MSDDLGFTITTRMGDAVRKLGQLASSVASIGKASATATVAGAKLTQGFGILQRALPVISSQFGQIVGQLGPGAGLGGTLGRVAVAVGIASMAWKAYDAANRQAIANVRAQIAAQRELSQATRGAQQAAIASGQGARGQEGGLRRLVALGGSQADVDAVVGRYGVGAEDASAALVALRQAGLAGEREERALQAAQLLQRSGRAGFAEAAARIAGSRGASSQGSVAGVAAVVASEISGSRVSAGRIMSEAALVRRDQALGTFDAVRAVEGRTDLARLDQFQATGVQAARDELSRTTAPLAAALGELARRRDEEIAVLARLAEVQNGLAAAIANGLMIVGGEGSFEQQRRRAIINNAAVQGIGY